MTRSWPLTICISLVLQHLEVLHGLGGLVLQLSDTSVHRLQELRVVRPPLVELAAVLVDGLHQGLFDNLQGLHEVPAKRVGVRRHRQRARLEGE